VVKVFGIMNKGEQSRICSAQELAAFIDRLRRTIASQPSSQAFSELDTALEELKVAEETVHEQAESLGKALQRADGERQRYLELFEFAPDAYCVTDTRGIIREANRAMYDLVESSPPLVIGKPLMVFVPRDRRREVRNFIWKVREPHADAVPHYPLVWQTEFVLRRKHPIPISARCSLSRSSMADSPRLLWLLRDVTEQKRAEANLNRSRQRLERAVEEKTGELQERLAELESFHDVTVGRELRLMELEKKLKALESEHGST
jgi:PAS domain S-box-containing protein